MAAWVAASLSVPAGAALASPAAGAYSAFESVIVVSPVCSASLVCVFCLSSFCVSFSYYYDGSDVYAVAYVCVYCSSDDATSAAALSAAASSDYCVSSFSVLCIISVSSCSSVSCDLTWESLLSSSCFLFTFGFGFGLSTFLVAFFLLDWLLTCALLSYFDCFDDFAEKSEDFLSSTPDEKNLSILTMFLRKPHWACDLASTSAWAFCCTWELASSLLVVWIAAFWAAWTWIWASWTSSRPFLDS